MFHQIGGNFRYLENIFLVVNPEAGYIFSFHLKGRLEGISSEGHVYVAYRKVKGCGTETKSHVFIEQRHMFKESYYLLLCH